MKKTLLILAALFFSGFISAQMSDLATRNCVAPEGFCGEYNYTNNDMDQYFGTSLRWENPSSDFWFHYDEEPMAGAVSVDRWGIKIPRETFNGNPCAMTRIMFYKTGCQNQEGRYYIGVYFGEEDMPTTLMYVTSYAVEPGADEWVELEMLTPVYCTSSESVWVIMWTDGLSDVSAYCPSANDPNARWAWLPEYGWHDYLATSGVGGDWMVRAYFMSESKEGNKISHFNIYRGETLESMAQIAETGAYSCFYYDTLTASPGEYYYRLTASYEDGCESVYALDKDNPENDYVHIYATEVATHGKSLVSVYPNPSKERIVIQGINAVEVRMFNTIGQRVATATVAGGETLQVDIATLPAGVYFVNVIDTEGRKCVRKVVKE